MTNKCYFALNGGDTWCPFSAMPDPETIDFVRAIGRRPRVVIGHPFLARGGSEATLMWLAEALKSDCDVTVFTTQGWDLEELNRYYGTRLNRADVAVRYAPSLGLLGNVTAAALRCSLYQRFARRIASEYDLRVSAYNITDWGMPAVHFIADFSWHAEIRQTYDPQAPGLIYRDTPLRRAYLSFARACASPSARNPIADDRLVANSHWSAAQLQQHYGLPPLPVVYPPVWASFPDVPWPAKKEGFVMIGRIAPEKRIEAAIRVIAALRSHGHRLTLHICGSIPADGYGRKITALCEANRDWACLQGPVSGLQKATLLARYKYGIQARASEPFGISIAEMVKAGAIVFAPNHGGQAEILNRPDLLFADEAAAVEKIQAVLENPDLQSSLRAHLACRAELFSAQRFMREARAQIAGTLIAPRETAALLEGQPQ
jgi:glycosyltransferase involved in cell wall biosynthesis